MIIGAIMESKNSKYDFKTLKVRLLTYKRLIKYKAILESKKQNLYSFDAIINYILDKVEEVETFSANDNKEDELSLKNG